MEAEPKVTPLCILCAPQVHYTSGRNTFNFCLETTLSIQELSKVNLVQNCCCCSTPQGSPGVGRNTFLSSPHLCFIIVFICDLFVSRDDPLMS